MSQRKTSVRRDAQQQAPEQCASVSSHSASAFDFRRLWLLVVAALAGTALTLGFITLLTPLKPIDFEDAEPSSELPSGDPSAVSHPEPDQEVLSTTLTDLLAQLREQQQVKVSVEELRNELIALADEMSGRFPMHAAALHLAAMVYAELGNSSKAEKLWKQSIELNPAEVGPYLGLSTILIERGDDSQAIELLTAAKKSGRVSPELFRELGSAYSKIGELEQAESLLAEGVKIYTNSAPLWLELGICQLQLMQPVESETSLRRAIVLGERSERAFITLASALTRQHKTEDAARVRSQLSEVQPMTIASDRDQAFQSKYVEALVSISTNCYTLAAAVLSREGLVALAESKLRRAIQLNPLEPSTYIELSTLFRTQGRVVEALAVQQRLLDLQPNNILNHINVASVASQLGELELAQEVLELGIKVRPDHAFLYGELAKLSLLKRNYGVAISRARQAAEREPKNVEWPMMIAIASRAMGDFPGAAVAVETARKISPNDPRLEAFNDVSERISNSR